MTSVKLDRASDTGISSGACSMRPCYMDGLKYNAPCCTIGGMDTTPQVTCTGQVDDLLCPRPAATYYPFPICQQHRVEIAMSVNREVLGNELSSLMAIPTTPLPRPDAVAVESLLKGPHEEVVYFIANGGRVKVGFSTNLRSRLAALSLRKNNVLAALEGGPELEQVLHAHFAEHRRGNTEWFDLAPEIVRYISETSKNPRSAVQKPQGEMAAQRAAEVRRSDILSRALRVIDRMKVDRVTREQLAKKLTGGDEEKLRTQVIAAGCRPPQPIRVGGKYQRGWYRHDFAPEAVLAVENTHT